MIIIIGSGHHQINEDEREKNKRIPQTNEKVPQKERQLLGPCQKTKKAVEHESNDDTNYNWRAWNGSQRLQKGTGRVGNWQTNRDYPNYSSVKIRQNTEKCPGDPRRLVVTQPPVKDHRLTLR